MRFIKHLIIRGRVQGVGYRAFVESEAFHRGLEGWVRNRQDGTVEAVLAGPSEELDLMIAACRDGPLGARVDHIIDVAVGAEALSPRRPGERFSVLPTQ